jgi:chorismate mutase
MNKLDKLREAIDQIDDELIKLLEKRMAIVDEVVEFKRTHDKDIYDQDREQEIINKLKQKINNKRIEPIIIEMFEIMMDLSKQYQRESHE